jgi:tRNA acetyltransferase TAN1
VLIFRFVKRLVPILGVGGATLKQIGDVTQPLVAERFATPDNRPLKASPSSSVMGEADLQFAIQTNSRNSNKLDRLEMIKKIADEVVALPAGHTVDLSNADRTILVEVDKVHTRQALSSSWLICRMRSECLWSSITTGSRSSTRP